MAGGRKRKKRKGKKDQEEGRREGRKEARKRKKKGRIGRQTEEGWKKEARTRRREMGEARAHGSFTQASRIPCPRGTKGSSQEICREQAGREPPTRPATDSTALRRGPPW